jgi:hypothetical protein
MNFEKVYDRVGPAGAERLTVMAYIGVEDQDGDEIRLIRTTDGQVVEDGIVFHGEGGEQWLRDQHQAWTQDGFEVSEAPDA